MRQLGAVALAVLAVVIVGAGESSGEPMQRANTDQWEQIVCGCPEIPMLRNTSSTPPYESASIRVSSVS